MTDHRQYAPATLRTCDFILDVLRGVLPMTGVILEIASGSGERAVHFARISRASFSNHRAAQYRHLGEGRRRQEYVHAPIALERLFQWPIASADGIICINMIRINVYWRPPLPAVT